MKNVIDSLGNNKLMFQTKSTSDGYFSIEKNADKIYVSLDKKIEFVILPNKKVIVGVICSTFGETYYPMRDVEFPEKITSVVMDLDGTTAISEKFWINVIKETFIAVSNKVDFDFNESDIPFISGHTTYEHLLYCLTKYDSPSKIDLAVEKYNKIAEHELEKLLKTGDDSIIPTNGLGNFINICKLYGVKIGLVTSGSYEKAYPEIQSIIRQLKYSEIAQVYDTVITAGSPLSKYHIGTMGQLVAKPHPWLYMEALFVGLNEKNTDQIIGFEDSGAGVIALRLAGIPVIGVKGGNIIESGYGDFCECFVDDMNDAINLIIR